MENEIDTDYIKENYSQLLELKELIPFDEYDNIVDLKKKDDKLIKTIKNYDKAVKKASEKLEQGILTTLVDHLKHFLPEKEEVSGENEEEDIKIIEEETTIKEKHPFESSEITITEDIKVDMIEKINEEVEIEKIPEEKLIKKQIAQQEIVNIETGLDEKTREKYQLKEKIIEIPTETLLSKKDTLSGKKTHITKRPKRKIPITNDEKLQKVIDGSKKTIKKAKAATPTDTLRITIEKEITDKILELFEKKRIDRNKSASGAIKEILYKLSQLKKGDKIE